MLDMKCDNGRAATALAATKAIAELNCRVNLLTVMPLVENMPSGMSVKLGDVLKARNGKTIEISQHRRRGARHPCRRTGLCAEQKVNQHRRSGDADRGGDGPRWGPRSPACSSNDDAWRARFSGDSRGPASGPGSLPMDKDFEEALKSKVGRLQDYPAIATAARYRREVPLEAIRGQVPWSPRHRRPGLGFGMRVIRGCGWNGELMYARWLKLAIGYR